MDTVIFLRSAYVGAALSVIFVSVTPPLRRRFLAYGARATSPPTSVSAPSTPSPPTTKSPKSPKSSTVKKKPAVAKKEIVPGPPSAVSRLLDTVAQWKVPHSWFWSFYFLSTCLSLFWFGELLLFHGPIYRAIASRTAQHGTAMTFDQVKIAWGFLFLHCAWRVTEYVTTPPASQSSGDSKAVSMMWIGHWLLGISFYVLTSVAVWIEGLPTLEAMGKITFDDLMFRAPSLQMIAGILIFILASGFQSDCHAYLARLRSSKSDKVKQDEHGYKVPQHPAFQTLIAPHYTAECLKYFALTIVAAPPGERINLTLSCTLLFVVVNLGITARVTRQWYQEKFGPEAVKDKWNLVPGVY